ncbi:MAG: dihydropteroate synthase [Actinomycetales bacterium]|nr:dihydropteroate synthase [Actinomycetales bacterium]
MRRHPAGLPERINLINRTLVIGVLNVTPDSFSDGGNQADTQSAVAHGLALAKSGADIIDVGGESTRPGAERVSITEELDRVIPVVQGLVSAGQVVSVDTMRAEVAAEAVAAGAMLINDVSAGKADPKMFSILAEVQVPYIMMHWRGHSTEMMTQTNYKDLVAEVTTELMDQVNQAVAAGISPSRIVLDPGIGFAKKPEHNWPLLAKINQFQELGYPVLVGASRKRFIGELLAVGGVPRDVDNREYATAAVTTLMAQQNIWAVRVHDAQASADAIAVVERLRSEDE